MLALSYKDDTVAFAEVNARALAVFLGLIILVGACACFGVPKLPAGMRRRDFGVFSLMSALDGLERGSGGNGEKDGWMGVGAGERGLVDIAEMEEKFGDIPVRYGVQSV